MKSIFFFSGLCLLLLAFLPFEARIIKGTVLDNQQHPVQGASIVIKGTQKGTVTDSAGHFTITVNSEKDVLVISAVGYQVKQLALPKADEVTIALKVSAESLSEVVVTGYGAKRKAEADEETREFAYAPSPASRALSGSASGLYVNNQPMRKPLTAYDKKNYNSQQDSDYQPRRIR